jgi:hypothetical protein
MRTGQVPQHWLVLATVVMISPLQQKTSLASPRASDKIALSNLDKRSLVPILLSGLQLTNERPEMTHT